MLSNKDVERINGINLGTYKLRLGEYLRSNDFNYIEPYYSDRVRYGYNNILEQVSEMVVALAKKQDIKCTVTFNLASVGMSDFTETVYMGEKITLPDDVPLVEGKRLIFVDNKQGPVNADTYVMSDITVNASYVDNAYTYVKYFNAADRFNPYESHKIKLNGDIPMPSSAPVAPGRKTTFIGWFNVPQSFTEFALEGPEPIELKPGSKMAYQPKGVDIIKGDITNDGMVDISDAITLMRIMASTEVNELTAYQRLVADYREDGTIDVGDVIDILQAVAIGAKSVNVSELCLYAWWA